MLLHPVKKYIKKKKKNNKEKRSFMKIKVLWNFCVSGLVIVEFLYNL